MRGTHVLMATLALVWMLSRMGAGLRADETLVPSREAIREIRELIAASAQMTAPERQAAIARCESFRKHKYLDVRVSAGAAIIRLQPGRAEKLVPELLTMIRSSKSMGMHAQTIARSNPKATIAPLIAEARNSENQWIRAAAFQGLVGILDHAMPKLRVIFDEGDGAARRYVISIISAANEAGLIGRDLLEKGLGDDDPGTQLAAAHGLLNVARSDGADALPILIREYPRVDETQRMAIVRSAQRLGTQVELAKPLFELALADSNFPIQLEAAFTAEQAKLVDYQDLVPVFAAGLTRADRFRRTVCAQVLARRAGESTGARESLDAVVVDKTQDAELVSTAAMAVALMDRSSLDRMLPLVTQYLNREKSTNYRDERLIWHLASLESAAASTAPTLRELLRRPKQRKRCTIALALISIVPEDCEDARHAIRDVLNERSKSYDNLQRWRVVPGAKSLVEDAIKTLLTSDSSRVVRTATALIDVSGADVSESIEAIKDRAKVVEDKYLGQALSDAATRFEGR